MNNEIKKDLTSNWFKLLQNAICDDINKLEKNKTKFKTTTWQRNKNRRPGCKQRIQGPFNPQGTKAKTQDIVKENQNNT